MEQTITHTYIPKEFKRTFRGFKTFGFDDEFKEFLRKEKRKQQLQQRCSYTHTSRGGQHLQRDIKEIVHNCIQTDWRYNGEDEYPVDYLDKGLIAKRILQYLKQKKVLKHLI